MILCGYNVDTLNICMKEFIIFVCTDSTEILSKPGLPRSGKKFWKMKIVPGQGKVREFHFQSGKFRKNEKSWKSQGISKISKKLLVNWLLVFHKLQAILEKECFLT